MDKRTIYQEIILSNSSKPSHKAAENTKSQHNLLCQVATCSDEFIIHFDFSNGIITNVTFSGQGCAISTAAINLLCSYLENKTKEEALLIIENYKALLHGEKYDTNLLQDLIAFENVNKHLNRVTCALVGANALKDFLENHG